MEKIKVVDSIMGAGKTSYAVQMMNDRKDTSFLYITPFLDEVDRIVKECGNRNFVQPEKNGFNNKSDHLKELLAEGCNIASTHELFKRIDNEALELIKANNYVLVLDEVMQVLEPLESDIKEVESLLAGGILKPEIEPDDQHPIVKLTLGEITDGFKRYDEYRAYAETGRLVLCNNRILMWLFPTDAFKSFEEVWNLCYIFDGQIQKAYYDIHDLGYEYFSVEKGRNKWKLIAHDLERDAEVIRKLKPLINIYEGKLNDIGDPDTYRTKRRINPFSKTWLKKSRYLHSAIRKNLYNYFRNIAKAKSTECMWTTFRDFQNRLQGNGFSRSFVGVSKS